MKQNKNKATYVAPSIEIIEMENEGVIAASGGSNGSIGGIGNGGVIGTRSNARSYSASSNDLEDMINDILTIEN